jgi:hypothetical protein
MPMLLPADEKVRHAGGGHVVDRVADDRLAEERLAAIGDVVGDDVRLEALLRTGWVLEARQRGERADVVAEFHLADHARDEGEARTRRHLVDDFDHAAAFVGADGRFVLQHDPPVGY